MNNGDSRCQGMKKMLGSGYDGGGVTEERQSSSPAVSPDKAESVGLRLDLYTQAFKVLSERSPFDSEEVLAKTSATLPSGLAGLLKNTDSRRRHKKHHSDTKKSRKSSGKSKNSNIWVELEEYFRELKGQDIERLSRLSLLVWGLECSNSCFEIPVVGNVARNDHDSIIKVVNDQVGVLAEEDVVENVVKDVGRAESRVLDSEIVEIVGEELNLVGNGSMDSVGELGHVPESSTHSCSSIEWVLGSRNRVLLTTTRPSKKRKLVGENAGLERLIVARPCEGKSCLCHVCSMGDTGDQLNQLVVCSMCKVVVHQKCYGVQGEVYESWMCAWCKHKSKAEVGMPLSCDRPCVLCPKSGGASKRFKRTGNDGSIEFAHLFCSLWMPEVYIEDTRLMEPLLSVDGAKDVRGKALCTLCKSKLGCCVRCSDGLCKTPVHPICAREAGNKLEIWGKFGCDDIELRAFCSKHSGDGSVVDGGTLEKNERSHAVDSSTHAVTGQQGKKIKKLKIGRKNGDKVMLPVGAADDNIIAVRDEESQDLRLKDMVNMKHQSGSGSEHDLSELQYPEQKCSEAVSTSSADLGVILNRLLERGKVSLQQVSSGIGITEDYLATKLTSNHLGSELSCKILKWLQDHAHLDTGENDMRAKIRRLISPKFKSAVDDNSDSVTLIDLDMPDVVPVKSVPSRRRTVGHIVNEDKTRSPWNEKQFGNDELLYEGTVPAHVNGGHDRLSEDAISDVGKIMVETNALDHPSVEPSPTSESTLHKLSSPLDSELKKSDETTCSREAFVLDIGQEPPSCSHVNTVGSCDGYLKPRTNAFVHPYIQKKLREAQSWFVKKTPTDYYGCAEVVSIPRNELPPALVSSEYKIHDSELINEVKLDDQHLAKAMAALDLTPQDELEGEIIYSQQWLLRNAVALKCHADQLVCKVVRSVPHEMDSVRTQRWDDVLVNQYVHELKEARKQGRKERRHKEAQVVLAVATAAAAASSRMSSLRKDAVDGTPLQELKLESSRLRGSLSSLSVSRAMESNLTLDVPKAMSDRYPDIFHYASGSPKEPIQSCDICRRPESLLNPVLVCLSCKVAVHLNCYRSVTESTGPWYCELCEESSVSKVSRITVEKPHPIAECGLCGASNGAFRKSSNGQWIHAFCAEWVFDSTFRRGQVHPVTGMDLVAKGSDICSVCQRRFGVCIKCFYGNCQSTFHPSCARSSGYYLYTKNIGGGKMQRKAYCSKHSLEQRAKVETQKHEVEDLKLVKQHRVKLEKLRLLCERIVKREKLKRELVLCNRDILVSKRDYLPFSILVYPSLSQEVSSDSVTTSLRAHSRSYSEAMQKSDDVTVDSVLSSKRFIRLPLSVNTDKKTDDSSTSQRTWTPKPPERVTFAGKQIPVREAMNSRNISPGAEQSPKSKKNTETFEKEVVMTSDQASMRNQRLPKGYFYVPLNSLSNEKPASQDSVERNEVDG